MGNGQQVGCHSVETKLPHRNLEVVGNWVSAEPEKYPNYVERVHVGVLHALPHRPEGKPFTVVLVSVSRVKPLQGQVAHHGRLSRIITKHLVYNDLNLVVGEVSFGPKAAFRLGG